MTTYSPLLVFSSWLCEQLPPAQLEMLQQNAQQKLQRDVTAPRELVHGLETFTMVVANRSAPIQSEVMYKANSYLCAS